MKLFKTQVCFSFMFFPITFLAIGILLIYIGYPGNLKFNQATEVYATVSACKSDIDDDGSYYSIYIDYEFNGTEYKNVYLETQNSSMDIGKEITVRVHPNDPTKPMSSSSIITFIVGIPIALFGAVMSFKMIPDSFERKETVIKSKNKKLKLFALIPLGIVILFIILSRFSLLFHLGTIIFSYFTIVLVENL